MIDLQSNFIDGEAIYDRRLRPVLHRHQQQLQKRDERFHFRRLLFRLDLMEQTSGTIVEGAALAIWIICLLPSSVLTTLTALTADSLFWNSFESLHQRTEKDRLGEKRIGFFEMRRWGRDGVVFAQNIVDIVAFVKEKNVVLVVDVGKNQRTNRWIEHILLCKASRQQTW